MKSSFVNNVRMKQRILFLSIVSLFIFIYVLRASNVNTKAASYYHLNSIKPEDECILQQENKKLELLSTPEEKKERRAVKYLDLNEENKNKQHILLLTTLTGSENIDTYLNNYFNLIDDSTYANKLITISFLLTHKDQKTLELLQQKVQQYQYSRWNNQFFQINIFQKDFKSSDTSRAKNFLLTLSLKEYHDWVFWLDLGLYSFPRTIFHDLISLDEDVIVPNCLLKRDNMEEFWAYDRNNWQESDTSLLKQQYIPENQVINQNDNSDIFIGRHLLVDMPTHLGMSYRVPLDGVGGSFIMIRSAVHRQGAIFPPFVYQHQIDTEGFAKMVKSMGFSIYGIPGYTIHHY